MLMDMIISPFYNKYKHECDTGFGLPRIPKLERVLTNFIGPDGPLGFPNWWVDEDAIWADKA